MRRVKKRYTFVLNCGYAESQKLASVPFTSRGTYANAKEALLDLAHFFKEHFRSNEPPKKCCAASKEKAANDPYCSKCGTYLAEEAFDPEAFMAFIQGISDSDLDSFHGDFIEYDESLRWQSEGMDVIEKKGMQTRFVYQAEKVMAAAIGHSPDDRVNIDTIFKRRTESKEKSFSFW